MNFIKEAVSIRRSIDLQGDSILEIAISELFRNGILAGHIKKAVRIYRERRDNFNKLIREKLSNYISYRIPDGGLAIWAHFKNADLVKIASNAAKKGLIMYDGRIYNTKNSSNTTRLGFSSLNFNEQERAVNILQECIEEILDSKTGI